MSLTSNLYTSSKMALTLLGLLAPPALGTRLNRGRGAYTYRLTFHVQPGNRRIVLRYESKPLREEGEEEEVEVYTNSPAALYTRLQRNCRTVEEVILACL